MLPHEHPATRLYAQWLLHHTTGPHDHRPDPSAWIDAYLAKIQRHSTTPITEVPTNLAGDYIVLVYNLFDVDADEYAESGECVGLIVVTEDDPIELARIVSIIEIRDSITTQVYTDPNP